MELLENLKTRTGHICGLITFLLVALLGAPVFHLWCLCFPCFCGFPFHIHGWTLPAPGCGLGSGSTCQGSSSIFPGPRSLPWDSSVLPEAPGLSQPDFGSRQTPSTPSGLGFQ